MEISGFNSNGTATYTNSGLSSDFYVYQNSDKTKYLLNGFEQGQYVFVIYDTKTGAELLTTHAWANFANILKLKIPFVTLDNDHPDVAFKFWRVNISGNDLRTIDSINTNDVSYTKEKVINEKTHSIQVFPNPTQNVINVAYFNSEKASYKLIDCTGQIVFEGTLQQNNISEISLSEFAAGIYNLIVYNSSENFNFKIIKQL